MENASKYTGEGGEISLGLEELDEGERQVGTYRFVIEDNGIGMKPEFLQHIFEPFSRADDSRISKITGTGLGMTIVQNLVSMMGGDIQVQSEYGKGSRFQVTFCLLKKLCENRSSRGSGACGGGFFQNSGSISGGQRAKPPDCHRNAGTAGRKGRYSRKRETGGGGVPSSAVLLRYRFYGRADARDERYEATREIRALPMEAIGELPVIAMTADAFAEDAKRARLAGMSGHLAKPISISQLRKPPFLHAGVEAPSRARGGSGRRLNGDTLGFAGAFLRLRRYSTRLPLQGLGVGFGIEKRRDHGTFHAEKDEPREKICFRRTGNHTKPIRLYRRGCGSARRVRGCF